MSLTGWRQTHASWCAKTVFNADSFGYIQAHMQEATIIREKIQELIEALKADGLWLDQQPAWVRRYNDEGALCSPGFFEWLQFIYLPNLLREAGRQHHVVMKENLTPQAIRFFGEDVKRGNLLQLLIELDSLL